VSAIFRNSFWHYILVILLNYHPFEPARIRGNSQFGVDVAQLFFRTRGLADVESLAVPLLEGGGDPVLAAEFFPQRCPAFVDPVLFKFPADHLDCLVSENGDE